ncbi:MAG TPA: hypothetical protein VK595_13635, partial [Vicinamibacterales bacterium]|nr:hypothetical protein [Vicinamibacterales bacterium]
MNRLGLPLVLLFISFAGVAHAQAKRPLTHELMWSFQRVGVPVPSPDGKWVVFGVNEVEYDPQKDVTDLWIVPGDGSAKPRRLTSTKGGESGPAWSADGRRVAFAAKRDEDDVAQIYVLDVGRGGEAQRVTNAPTAASVPRWSPDGKRIVFVAAMWPEATDEESNRKAATEKKNAKSKVRMYETFPIRDFDKWLDESKAHLWVADVDGDRKSRSLMTGTSLAALPGFNLSPSSAQWTPDGRSVVFAAADHADAGARAMVNASLWLVAAAGGEPKRLGADE